MAPSEKMIRDALKKHEIYLEDEINACRIYKNWEGWQIEKFGELPWSPGDTLPKVLDTIQEIVEARELSRAADRIDRKF